MIPINDINGIPAIPSFTPPTATRELPQEKKSPPLLPLIEMAPDNSCTWNESQNPDALNECVGEMDLYSLTASAIRRRSSNLDLNGSFPEPSLEKSLNFLIIWNPTSKITDLSILYSVPKVIHSFEQLLFSCDIELDIISLLKAFDKILKDINIEIKTDQQAYAVYLLFVYCLANAQNSLALKCLSALKNYMGEKIPGQEKSPLLKKITLLLLTRSNPEVALKVIDTELKAFPDSLSLKVLKGNILYNQKKFLDVMQLVDTINVDETRYSDIQKSCVYGILGASFYESGHWTNSLRIFESFLALQPESAFSNSDIYPAELLSRIYRFGGMTPSPIFLTRFLKTFESIFMPIANVFETFKGGVTFVNTALNVYEFVPVLIDLYLKTSAPKPQRHCIIYELIEFGVKLRKNEPIKTNQTTRLFGYGISDLLFSTFLQQGNLTYEQSLSVLNTILTIDPQHLDARYEEARTHMNAGNIAKALELVTRCCTLASFPRSSWVILRAICLYKSSKYLEAAEACHQYIKAKPDDAVGYLELAKNYIKLDEINKAKDNLEICITKKNEELEVRLSAISYLLVLDPDYPSFLENIKPILNGPKETAEKGYFVKAKWLMNHGQTDEARNLLKYLNPKDSRYAITKAGIFMSEKKYIQALEYVESYLKTDKTCQTLFKCKLDLLLILNRYSEFEKELIAYQSLKISEEELVISMESFIKYLLNKYEMQKAMTLYQRLKTLHPNNKRLQYIYDLFQKDSSSPDQAPAQTDKSNFVISDKIDFDFNLTPLMSVNSDGDFEWDFDQDEQELDRRFWNTQIHTAYCQEVIKRFPRFNFDTTNPTSFDVENPDYIKNAMIAILKILGNPALQNAEENLAGLSDLMSILYILKKDKELTLLLGKASKPEVFKLFSHSTKNYIGYHTFLLAILKRDISLYPQMLQYFDNLSTTHSTAFLEKLKILISIPLLTNGEILNRVDKSIERLETFPGPNSLRMFKANLLIEFELMEEAEVLLNSFSDTEKSTAEYHRLRCLYNFIEQPFEAAQNSGETYFKLTKRNYLNSSDLQIAFILSTIYRYKKTGREGTLYNRLINTFNNPGCLTFSSKTSYQLFLNMALNLAVNNNIDFSSQKIVIHDHDDVQMKHAKKTILYWWGSLRGSLIKKVDSLEDPRISELLISMKSQINRETCLVSEVWYVKALACVIEGNYPQALSHLDNVGLCDSMHLDSMFTRAIILFKQGKTEETYSIIDYCMSKTSDYNKEWWDLYRTCLIKLKSYKEALVAVRKSIAVEPENSFFICCEISLLLSLNLQSEALQSVKKILDKPLDLLNRFALTSTLLHFFEKPDVELFQTLLFGSTEVLDAPLESSPSGFELCISENDLKSRNSLKAYYYIKIDQIEDAKKYFALYGEKGLYGIFLQVAIQFKEKDYEGVLETTKKWFKLYKKSISEQQLPQQLMLTELRLLKFSALFELGRYQDICNDPLETLPQETPEFIVVKILEIFSMACEKCNQIDKALKALEKATQTYKKDNRVLSHRILTLTECFLHMQLDQRLQQAKETPLPKALEIQKIEDQKKDGLKNIKEEKNVPDFIFAPKKPSLVIREWESFSRTSQSPNPAVHPAKAKEQAKQLQLAVSQARVEIQAMFANEPLQREVGMSIREMLELNLGLSFDDPALYEEIILPTPPAISRIPLEAPTPTKKASTPSASIPIVTDSHRKRLATAQISVTELKDCSKLFLKENSNLDPLYQYPPFVSRLLNYHLFRWIELMKAVKGMENISLYNSHVKLIIKNSDDVKLLRNLISLHGHRMGVRDLLKFIDKITKGGVSENLVSLSLERPQEPQNEPILLEFEDLFPKAFTHEWNNLEPDTKKKALLEMILRELNFLSEIKIDPETWDTKGKNIHDVLKCSILRIGKAISRLRIELKITITHPALVKICTASKKVRHQINSLSSVIPEEIQSTRLWRLMRSVPECYTGMAEEFGTEFISFLQSSIR